jgi:hypothetical protein
MIKMETAGMVDGQKAGLAMLQVQPNWIGVVQSEGKRRLTFASAGVEKQGPAIDGKSVQLRMHV